MSDAVCIISVMAASAFCFSQDASSSSCVVSLPTAVALPVSSTITGRTRFPSRVRPEPKKC